VIIDDLATRGTSIQAALPTLRDAGLIVQDAVVLVDRGSGAGPLLAEAGVRLHAACTLTALLRAWQGRVPAEKLSAARRFIAGSR